MMMNTHNGHYVKCKRPLKSAVSVMPVSPPPGPVALYRGCHSKFFGNPAGEVR